MTFLQEPRRKARLFSLLALLAALPLFADPEAVRKAREASDARPQHPRLLYELAQALEADGRRDEAVRVLERIAAMGFVYPVEKHFPAHERYASVAERFARNAKPIGTARRERVIDRLGLIPEGMAWDGRRFFVSSVRTKTIFADGKPFATAPWGVFGMAADPKRGVLWAATAALPQVEGFRAEDAGKAALLKIGLRDGKILETLQAPEGKHHLGDVALAPDGEVYVSDSASPTVFRVNGSALEPFVTGPFRSLQGLAVAGPTLYVSDYALGLFAIDRRTRDLQPLRVPPAVSLLGVDGLYAADGATLIATQNGTTPFRVLRIALAPGGVAVASVRTLLANSPDMGEPTLGVIAGDRFHFNANSQWALFGEDGKISDPLELSEAVVLSVPWR